MNIIALVLNIVKILQIHHIPVINMLIIKIHQDAQVQLHQFIIKMMMVSISIQTIAIVVKLLNIIEHSMMETNVLRIVLIIICGMKKVKESIVGQVIIMNVVMIMKIVIMDTSIEYIKLQVVKDVYIVMKLVKT